MINKELTDDFVESFPTKEDCAGAFAQLVIYNLPNGVDGNDARVKQIIQWCKEND